MDDNVVTIRKVLSQFRPSLIHDPAPFIPPGQRVLYGTIAGMVATALVHPFDLIKTRLQVSKRRYTTFGMMRRIITLEGYLALYHGFTAGLWRQFFTTGTRLSCYNYLYDVFKKTHERRPKLDEKVKMGLIAGITGAIVGSPSEVILIRMMAASAPKANNPDVQDLINNKYTDCANAFKRIIREEGVRALFRGGSLTIIRSTLNTTSQIGVYGLIRDNFQKKMNVKEGYFLHVITAMLSSLIFATISVPVDVVKTRYQMRRRGITKKQIFMLVVKQRGPLYFWKGPMPAYYFRITLHTLTSFFVLEGIENSFHEEEKEYYKSNKI